MQRMKVQVKEFTTPDPITVKEGATIDDMLALMSDHGIRHLPVLRGTEVVGIISDRDVRLVAGLTAAEKYQVQASDIMAENPVTVPATMALDEAAFIMSDKKVGSVIVIGDDGDFLGIFTVTDALNALIEIMRGCVVPGN
jgi:acetoin utilization protein AcuB